MQMRQPPSPAVDPKKPTVRRTCSTVITVRSVPESPAVRSSTRRSPWAFAEMRRATGCVGGNVERTVAVLHGRRRRIRMGEDEPGDAGRRASPCRCRRRRRSARRAGHAAAAGSRRAARPRRRRDRTARWCRAGCGTCVVVRVHVIRSVLQRHRRGCRIEPAVDDRSRSRRRPCSLGRRESITTQRLRLGGGDRQIGVAQPGMEVERLGLEAVGLSLSTAPAAGPLETDFGRHVEDEGQVRHGIGDDDALEAADDRGRSTACRGRPGRRGSSR